MIRVPTELRSVLIQSKEDRSKAKAEVPHFNPVAVTKQRISAFNESSLLSPCSKTKGGQKSREFAVVMSNGRMQLYF